MNPRTAPSLRRRVRRALAVAATVSVGMLGIAACSTGGGDGKGVTLTVWYNTQDPAAVKGMYTAYEKKSGNTLKLVPISSDGFEAAELTKWATGDRPDIMEMNGGPSVISQYDPAANFIDLSDMAFVKKAGGVYKTGGFGPDGKIYNAITNFPEVWGLYYNKSVLDKFGLKPATTYAELSAQCKVLSAAGVTTVTESGASQWPTFGLPFLETTSAAPTDWDAQILAKKSTINGPDSPLLTGLTHYKDLIDAGCMNSDITTATFEDSVAAVYSGKAAYEAIHSNIEPVYLDQAKGDKALLGKTVGFTPYGDTKAGVMVQPGVIGVYALPKTGDDAKEKAAKDFLEFITGPYYQTYIDKSGTFPILSGAKSPTDAGPLMQQIKDAYDAGPIGPLPSSGLTPGGYGDLLGNLAKLIVGSETPKQVVDNFQDHVASVAKSEGLKGW